MNGRRIVDGIKHGGRATGYVYYGCRCDDCTEAHKTITYSNLQKRIAAPKDPNDPRHGRYTFYLNHGCRCEPCTVAWNAHCRAQYASRKARMLEVSA